MMPQQLGRSVLCPLILPLVIAPMIVIAARGGTDTDTRKLAYFLSSKALMNSSPCNNP